MKRQPGRAFAATALVVVLAACSGRGHSATSGSANGNAKPSTLLVIGSSATEGDGVPDRFQDAWPYVLFNEAFPLSTSLVNAALDGATVANARTNQLPVAREVRPQVVAIWLGADDLAEHTPVATFAAGLRELVDDLRATGSRRILVADLPRAFGAGVASYDAAIRNVVRSTNVTLVELQHAAITLVPSRGSDEPDPASHRVIAAAFERALQPS